MLRHRPAALRVRRCGSGCRQPNLGHLHLPTCLTSLPTNDEYRRSKRAPVRMGNHRVERVRDSDVRSGRILRSRNRGAVVAANKLSPPARTTRALSRHRIRNSYRPPPRANDNTATTSPSAANVNPLPPRTRHRNRNIHSDPRTRRQRQSPTRHRVGDGNRQHNDRS